MGTFEDLIRVILEDLDVIRETLQNSKSEERNERDRYLAIAVTDLEKLMAFIEVYLGRSSLEKDD